MRRASNILVEEAAKPPVARRRFEICEHKGSGHPDTLTDGACEATATALARAYQRAFGGPRHFNVDKGLLVAGRSAPRFGGGRLLLRPKLIVCGRASDSGGGFDVTRVAAAAAREFLARTLRRGASVIRVSCLVRRGSTSLESAYRRGRLVSNDTSFGVGCWPYTPLESAVLEAASLLRSDEWHDHFPAAGDDFKVMGLRRDGALSLTVALAFVDAEIRSAAEYFRVKRAMTAFLRRRLCMPVALNTLDNPSSKDESGLYLTVTGMSAEMGDDGQVGRGNRVNGLITPSRPMSLEAAAGKNPAAHVGRVYNHAALRMARALCEDLSGVSEASVQLVSQIGRPVADPWAASVQVRGRHGMTRRLRGDVRALVRRHLALLGEPGTHAF